MKKFNHNSCPVCNGKLAYSRLICKECKAEFPVDESFSVFDRLSEEQHDFLILFLKSRGNISAISKAEGLPYIVVKKNLDDLLIALGFENIDLSNFEKVDINSKKPSDIIKRKLHEAGGKVTVKLLNGKDCIVVATEDGKSVTSDKLNGYTLKYEYTVFDIIVDLLKDSKDGKAPKGGVCVSEDKVGKGKCTEGTIVYHIAVNYLKKNDGYIFDPVFVLAAILDWAGIAKNRRGYVQLCKEYINDSEEKDMEKLELKFEKELLDKAQEAKAKYKYNASYFCQMIGKDGGVATAKNLIEKAIRTGDPSEGFVKLLMLGRLDLTMEDSVCKEEYTCLFTEEEIRYCKALLNR